MCSHWSLIAYGRIGMLRTLRPEILNVSANEGRVLIDRPGLAVTLDIEAASALSATARRMHLGPSPTADSDRSGASLGPFVVGLEHMHT